MMNLKNVYQADSSGITANLNPLALRIFQNCFVVVPLDVVAQLTMAE
jgi:hypothetical protein